MSMETYRRGWGKYHKGCKGRVQLRENLDPDAHHEWDLHCISCGKNVREEDVDFVEELND